MTFPCFSYRLAPSLTLLLGLAGTLAGCVDPKSIGLETADDGSGSAESGSAESGSEGSGGTSQGQTTGQTTGTDPTAGESGTAGCPPIDYGPCTECTCIDDEWQCEMICPASCEGLACGDGCLMCPEGEPDCAMPSADGICTAEGVCVGTPPPKLGFCEGALQPGFEDELDAVGGCGDVRIYAHDAADERGLVVQLSQELALAQTAIATGEPVHMELSATDPSVIIEGRAGFYVTTQECSDVIVDEPDIKENWLPTAGTVIVDVVPAGVDLAEATVQLVDVELHRLQPGPAPLVVNVTFSDVGVGWFPG
jgi:hypothetical protein